MRKITLFVYVIATVIVIGLGFSANSYAQTSESLTKIQSDSVSLTVEENDVKFTINTSTGAVQYDWNFSSGTECLSYSRIFTEGKLVYFIGNNTHQLFFPMSRSALLANPFSVIDCQSNLVFDHNDFSIPIPYTMNTYFFDKLEDDTMKYSHVVQLEYNPTNIFLEPACMASTLFTTNTEYYYGFKQIQKMQTSHLDGICNYDTIIR